MSSFYCYFGFGYNQVLVAGYRNGKKFYDKIPYRPYLFLPGEGEYKNVKGKNLKRVDFGGIAEARAFVKRYQEVASSVVYGLTNYPYVYIYENYPEISTDVSLVRVGNIDIETDSENGFGDIQKADRAIISFTIKVHGEKKIYVVGLKPYETKEPELLKMIEAGFEIIYVQCESERHLLLELIVIWNRLHIDIITGWNIEQFDIPYIMKRIEQVLSEEHCNRLSPFGKIEKSQLELYGNPIDKYEIIGIPILDYMQAYKKFSFVNDESYKLDYIAKKVLGVPKLDYSEYKTLARLYRENHDKFIDYNIIDVLRVEQLDDVNKFIDQIIMLAHTAKVNFVDTFTTVRIWDILIHNYLMDQKIAVPTTVVSDKERQIAGGHVKTPQIGKHNYVMSFDLTSLYPHLIMMYNISPETFKGKFGPIFGESSVDKILAGEMTQYRQDLIDNNVTVSGKGTVFTKEHTGFLPTLMKQLFQQRKAFKKQMLGHEDDLQQINAEIARRGLK